MSTASTGGPRGPHETPTAAAEQDRRVPTEQYRGASHRTDVDDDREDTRTERLGRSHHNHGADDRRHDVAGHDVAVAPVRDDTAARDKFGGLNLGAVFFGWLVAVGLAVLLVALLGAVATAIGLNADITQSEAQREAGQVGVVSAVVLLLVLVIGYYAGGYVAGRMSRFDGGRQGLGVWVLGLLVTLLAVALGVAFGAEYNLLDRVSLPRLPVPTDTLTAGGLVAAAAVLVGTLLAAMAGGKVGHRYHDRVDRAVHTHV